MARGSFDEEVRTAMRGMNSQRGEDNQQKARDTVARRRNVSERGVNSTAYKEKPPAQAKSKSKGGGGGKKRAPGKGAPPSRFKPDAGKRPDDLVKQQPADEPGLGHPDSSILLPILLALAGARKLGGGDPNDPRVQGLDAAKQLAPPEPVDLQKVPNAVSALPALNAPEPMKQLTYQPGEEMGMTGPYAATEAPIGSNENPMERNASRFLSESEIGDMQTRMPGVIKAPGASTKRPRLTFPHKLVK